MNLLRTFAGIGILLLLSSSGRAQSSPIYVSSGNGISKIDPTTQQIIGTIPIGAGFLAVSPDGSKVYCTTANLLQILDPLTNRLTGQVQFPDNVFEAVVAPDGSRIYITDNPTSKVWIVDATNNTIAGSIPVPGSPTKAVMSPDGTKLYTSGVGGVAVIDLASSTAQSISGPFGWSPTGITVSPDSSKIYVGEYNAAKVYVIDAKTYFLQNTFTIPNDFAGTFGLAVSPDGQELFVGTGRTINVQTGSRNVYALSSGDGSILANLSVGSPSQQIAFDQTGTAVYVGDSDTGNVDIIDRL